MKKSLLLCLAGALFVVQNVFATNCPSATALPAAPTLPFTQALSCGTTNDITAANAVVCGSTNYYGGQEALYTWTPTSNYSGVTIAYSGVSWSGIFVFNGCPTSGGTCVANITSSTTSKTLTVGNLTAGVTYYIMFDTWPTPNSPCPGNFTINGTIVAPCTAPPTVGATTAASNPVCPSVNNTLSLAGLSTGTGQTYQWQSSADGVTYTNIAGATNPTYVSNITAPTYFQAVITCSGQSSTSTPVFVTLNGFMNCYCTSNATSTADDDIGQITLGSFAYPATAPTQLLSNPASNGTYTNNTTVDTIDLIYNTSYPFTLTQINQTANYYQCDFGVYIDWNHNGLFTDPGEAVTGVGPAAAPAAGPHWTTTITVPTSALPGITRMRVVANETAATNPCGTYTWGETEDYSINVQCPVLAQPSALDAGVCSNNAVTLNASTSTTGATISWWNAPTGGTQVGSGTSFTTPTLTTSTSYYPQVDFPTCPSGPRDTVTVTVSAVDVVLTPVNATCNGLNNGSFTHTSTNCGTGPFTYSLDGGTTFGAIPMNLVAGTYSVIVQDATSATSVPYQVVVTEPTAPTALNATNVTYFNATLGWTAQGNETSWIVEYGPAGFTPGTGTVINPATNPQNITGLTENTAYEFYVAAGCAAGSDFAGPFAFSTDPGFLAWDSDCGPGFMDISTTGTAVTGMTDDSESGLTLPWAWNINGTTVNTITIGNNGGILFNTLTGNIAYTATGNGMFPYIQDLNTALAGGGIYYQSFGTAPNRQFVIEWKNMPHFSTGTDGATFEILVDEASGDFFYLYNDVMMSNTAWNNGADAEIAAVTPNGTVQVSMNSATYLSNNSCIRFYNALCPNPTNLTVIPFEEEAIVSWTAGLYGETQWTIVYGPEGFDPETGGVTVTSNTNSVSLLPLQQDSDYDVYVYAECAADNLTSENGLFGTFHTKPVCTNPTNLGATTDIDSLEATWTWTMNTNPLYAANTIENFNIEYGPTGFTQGTGTDWITNSTNNFDTIVDSSFIAGGVYQYYVQAVCATDSVSSWVGPFTFTMPLSNDLVCGADMIPVDGMMHTFNNSGATVETGEGAIAPAATGAQTTNGWVNSTLNNTVWFTFQAPASGSVRINATGINYNGQAAVYDIDDCANYATFTMLGANDDAIGGTSLAPNFTVCGLSQGQTYYLLFDGFNSTTGLYNLSVAPIVLEAGTANATMDVCTGTNVDLFNTISGNDSAGVWSSSIAAVNASINGSDFETEGLAYTTFNLQYRVTDGCAYDSIVSTVHIFAPSNAGTNGTISACRNEPIDLLAGLNNNADLEGTWYGPNDVALPNSQISASNIQGGYSYDYIAGNGVCPNDTALVVVNVGSCNFLGLEEEMFSGVEIFPNPSEGIVFITSDLGFSYEVTDANGRVIATETDGVKAAQKSQIDLRNAETGVYFIRLSNEQAQKTYRVVIR
jgi:hypothetical protein